MDNNTTEEQRRALFAAINEQLAKSEAAKKASPLKEVVISWYENNEVAVNKKAYEFTQSNLAQHRVSRAAEKEIGIFLGEHMAEKLLANPTAQNLDDIAKKAGVFLSTMSEHTIYMAMASFKANVEVQPNVFLVPVKEGSDKLTFNMEHLKAFAHTLNNQMGSSFRQHALIHGLTDIDDLYKQHVNQKMDVVINEELRAKGITPEVFFNKLAELENNYKDVQEMTSQLGIDAPQLSSIKPKVDVAAFREKLLNNSNSSDNANKLK